MKKRFVFLSLVSIGLIFIAASGPGTSQKTQEIKDPGLSVRAVTPDLDFGKFPLYFITNKGQVNQKARFYAKASRYTLWLTKQGLVFDSTKAQSAESRAHSKKRKTVLNSKRPTHSPTPPKLHRHVSRLVFRGANKNPEMAAVDEAKLRVNYFKGKDKSKWHGNIPTSTAVLYKNLYRRIDLKVYGIEKQVEYDWMVKPGGNPADIRFEYRNVKGTRLDDKGNLLIETECGELMHKRPVCYQEKRTAHSAERRAERIAVDVQFKKIAENTYGFAVAEYDKRYDLIIDPVVLAYSTYLGGGDYDYGGGIAVDSSGYVYVVGSTSSTDFPTLNQYQTDQTDTDVFITKIDPTQSGTSSLIYSSYLGGGNSDGGVSIAVDNNEYAYICGTTTSSNFPTLNQYQTYQSGYDAFAAKIDTTQSGTSSLVYSTYLGGSGLDYCGGIAVDGSGYAYLTGTTESTNFPTLNQYQTDQNYVDAFVTKMDMTESGTSSLLYSTYLGGYHWDTGEGIAVDGSGNAYVTGETWSSDFPTKNQYQTFNGVYDAFVTKINTNQSGSSSLVYSTCLGGTNDDGFEEYGTAIAVDSSGNAYVTGRTYASDFPTVNQYQTHQDNYDAFVAKIDTTESGTSSLIYSTYLGGTFNDTGTGIAVDSSGCAYVTGYTSSTNFPTAYQYQTDQGSEDAFVTKIDTTQSGSSSLIYSTYLGGSNDDRGYEIAVDSDGYAYVIGGTDSTNFPTLNQYQTDPGDSNFDAFVTRLILPIITVISPNGGENWKSGSGQYITWNTVGVVGDLKIYLWKDGALVGTIAKNIDHTLGSYSWITGQYETGKATVGTGYTVKIKEMGVIGSDFSDAPFTIYGITVTAPNGGESWQIGTTQNITWVTQGVSNNVKIFLFKDETLVGVIAKDLNPASGSYTWTVGQYEGGTASAGTGYTVKVKEMGVLLSDFSDSAFTLTN